MVGAGRPALRDDLPSTLRGRDRRHRRRERLLPRLGRLEGGHRGRDHAAGGRDGRRVRPQPRSLPRRGQGRRGQVLPPPRRRSDPTRGRCGCDSLQGALPHAALRRRERERDDSGVRLQPRSRAGQRRPHRQAVHRVRSDPRRARRAVAAPAAAGRRDRRLGRRLAGGRAIDAGEPQDRAALDHRLGHGGQGQQRRHRDEAVQARSGDRRPRVAPPVAERRRNRRHPDGDAARTERPPAKPPAAPGRQRVQRLARWRGRAGGVLALRRRHPRRGRRSRGAAES